LKNDWYLFSLHEFSCLTASPDYAHYDGIW